MSSLSRLLLGMPAVLPPEKEQFERPVDLRSTQTYSDQPNNLSHQPWNSVTHRPLRWRGCLRGTMVGDSPQQAKRHNGDEFGIWHRIPDFKVTLVPLLRFDINLWSGSCTRQAGRSVLVRMFPWPQTMALMRSSLATNGNEADRSPTAKEAAGFECIWMSLFAMTWYSVLDSY